MISRRSPNGATYKGAPLLLFSVDQGNEIQRWKWSDMVAAVALTHGGRMGIFPSRLGISDGLLSQRIQYPQRLVIVIVVFYVRIFRGIP